jgi:flagellar biosynthesis GTPase FlhF
MRNFMDRITGREGPDERVADRSWIEDRLHNPVAQHADEPSPDARLPLATRVNEFTESAGGDADREIARVGGRSGARAIAPDYAQFGEHVSSVVQAANEAAKKIEEDARSHAESLRERTHRQAASKLDDARREAEKLLVEAERLRTEAENESKETRERAETYAAEKLRDAEAEAAGVVTRAEQVAQSRVIAAEERSRELEANVELAEMRLQQLATGLFDTASRLDGLIERPVAHAAGEESASEPTGEGPLDEALAASVTRSDPEGLPASSPSGSRTAASRWASS